MNRPAHFGATLDAARYVDVRASTAALARGLSPEDCALQSMPEASPVKWHLGHTTWFWETFVLEPHLPGYRLLDEVYRYLFNSYYNAVGPQFPRPNRGLLSRPSLEAVFAYRRHVDDAMCALLEHAARSPSLQASLEPLVSLGFAHEQQHQELVLTDLKHLFDANPMRPVYRPRPYPVDSPGRRDATVRSGWCDFDAGLVSIGYDGEGFHFDNETPRHREFTESYSIADRPVSNAEYREFIEADGYQRPEFWLSEGFALARAAGWQAPAYWRREGGRWLEFGLHGEGEPQWNAPVCHVSYYEADAYARFAGARLPTEAEWERAADGHEAAGQFADSGVLHPQAPPPGALAGLFGGVWEWTASSYAAYPGYRPPSGAVGEYNGKFMVNQYVLRGGSCATPAGHVRASYRNFFPASARWQFSGVRLARDR